jgi:hypothetical protein
MRSNHLAPLRQIRPNNLHPLYALANKVANKVLSLPSDTACLVNSTEWFEQAVLLPRYQHQLKLHAERLPQLEAGERAIVKQLEQESICITSLDTLAIPNTSQLLDAARPITTELALLSRTPSHAGKHTLMATAQHLTEHPEILRWGLSERILNIVESYLGLPVGYGGLSFYYSVADGRDAGPRLWHRDKEDWRMLKVAVYLNDVDEAGGPYQCVKSTINDWLVKTLPKYHRLTHTKMQQLLADSSTDWLISCIGKTGTVIFTDTARCYHRGKPPIASARSAIFFHYFSRLPKNPFYCDRSPLSNQQLIEFDNQLPPHLQGYITWRNHYSGIGRYIPKNYMRVDNW